ncbi:MAG TPA: glycosyltransferase [Kineosporiaceae bacterium]|nr:glycosyltransferase [Kineosporiaceae bacterium]
MPEISMPKGMYLSVSGRIHPGSGGQTRALLLRNRLFAQYSDVKPILLALDDAPTYPQIRQTLLKQGELVEGMQLLNLFEWYRDNNIDHLPPVDEALPEAASLDQIPVAHPDGTLYQTQHVKRHGADLVMLDYHRADGSVYLRVPAGKPGVASPATKVYLVNSKGEPVGRWSTQRGWRRKWIRTLLEPKRKAFLFCDSRYAIDDILPLDDRRLHIMHIMHNIHVRSPFLWSSPLNPTYEPLFESIRHVDGLLTLTSRQGADIADRMGATDNMFVVANPVETPSAPDPLPTRATKHFVMIARLEQQKRIEDAIRAFALVLTEEPAATLEIFGDGTMHDFLSREIRALGVGDSVRLAGHDPRAREALWRATAMLMTSRFEGYPLATLESLSQGCPVISYDIKYGPREQLTHGVDGFLIEQGDLQGMADRMLELIRDPQLVVRLSQGAFEKAKHHDPLALLHDWRQVIEQVIERKPRRTTIESVDFEVTRLGYRRPHRLPDEYAKGLLRRFNGRRSGSGGFRKAPAVEFAGRLTLVGKSKAGTLKEAVFTLEAIDEASGTILALPLKVRRTGNLFRLSAGFDLTQAFATTQADALQLRLRLVWHNSSWQTLLARPRRLAPNYELSYADGGELTLLRGPTPGQSLP